MHLFLKSHDFAKRFSPFEHIKGDKARKRNIINHKHDVAKSQKPENCPFAVVFHFFNRQLKYKNDHAISEHNGNIERQNLSIQSKTPCKRPSKIAFKIG